MRQAMDETERRREIQGAYNEEHQITPETIRKSVGSPLVEVYESDHATTPTLFADGAGEDGMVDLSELRRAMRDAAENLDFERAAELRDRMKSLESRDSVEANQAGSVSDSRGGSSGRRTGGSARGRRSKK